MRDCRYLRAGEANAQLADTAPLVKARPPEEERVAAAHRESLRQAALEPDLEPRLGGRPIGRWSVPSAQLHSIPPAIMGGRSSGGGSPGPFGPPSPEDKPVQKASGT